MLEARLQERFEVSNLEPCRPDIKKRLPVRLQGTRNPLEPVPWILRVRTTLSLCRRSHIVCDVVEKAAIFALPKRLIFCFQRFSERSFEPLRCPRGTSVDQAPYETTKLLAVQGKIWLKIVAG